MSWLEGLEFIEAPDFEKETLSELQAVSALPRLPCCGETVLNRHCIATWKQGGLVTREGEFAIRAPNTLTRVLKASRHLPEVGELR